MGQEISQRCHLKELGVFISSNSRKEWHPVIFFNFGEACHKDVGLEVFHVALGANGGTDEFKFGKADVGCTQGKLSG